MNKNQTPLPCACTAVRKANRALFRYYENALAGSGLSVTQFSILRTLQRNGDTPLTELANELVMERTSLYRTIAPLIEAGTVALAPGKNKKIKVAKLTDNGITQINVSEPHWRAAQESFIAAIGEDNWQAISGVLQTVPGIVSALR